MSWRSGGRRGGRGRRTSSAATGACSSTTSCRPMRDAISISCEGGRPSGSRTRWVPRTPEVPRGGTRARSGRLKAVSGERGGGFVAGAKLGSRRRNHDRGRDTLGRTRRRARRRHTLERRNRTVHGACGRRDERKDGGDVERGRQEGLVGPDLPDGESLGDERRRPQHGRDVERAGRKLVENLRRQQKRQCRNQSQHSARPRDATLSLGKPHLGARADGALVAEAVGEVEPFSTPGSHSVDEGIAAIHAMPGATTNQHVCREMQSICRTRWYVVTMI